MDQKRVVTVKKTMNSKPMSFFVISFSSLLLLNLSSNLVSMTVIFVSMVATFVSIDDILDWIVLSCWRMADSERALPVLNDRNGRDFVVLEASDGQFSVVKCSLSGRERWVRVLNGRDIGDKGLLAIRK
jgi:hypothetical protein